MPLQSAGILLYHLHEETPQVLLLHPGGPYFDRKDLGVWTIPKGLLEGDEDGLAAAKREFREETGVEVPATHFTALKPVKQKGGKIVHAWAAEGYFDATHISSNTFRMEYPYKSGKWEEFPEADQAKWFELTEAASYILSGQAGLLLQLAALLS